MICVNYVLKLYTHGLEAILVIKVGIEFFLRQITGMCLVVRLLSTALRKAVPWQKVLSFGRSSYNILDDVVKHHVKSCKLNLNI